MSLECWGQELALGARVGDSEKKRIINNIAKRLSNEKFHGPIKGLL